MASSSEQEQRSLVYSGGIEQDLSFSMAADSENGGPSSAEDERRPDSISLSRIHQLQTSGGSDNGEESESFFIGIDFGTTSGVPLSSSFIWGACANYLSDLRASHGHLQGLQTKYA
jgi:hypothetical protein